MPPPFVHGVETIQVNSGVRPVNVVRSAVIALVGVAPLGTTNALTLVLSDADAAAFGSPLPGFTIPQALDAIRSNGPTPILVMNVFDSAVHTAAVSLEVHTLTAGKLKLDFAPLGAVSIFTSGGSPITAVAGTDYSIDAYGNFTNLSTTFTDATSYKFTYTKFDPTTVTTSHIIGTETSTTRTGLKGFKNAYNTFGFKPKIIIAPGFSSLSAVAAAMRSESPQYRAVNIVDAPNATTIAVALAGRGPSGSIPFNTSSKRDILAYPNLKAFDEATGADALRPYSGYFAGVMAHVDNEEGYHVSPSNHQISGITGMERVITWDVADPTGTLESTALNAAGIVTLANGQGTGIRVWGNRSSAYPTTTTPENFICVQRTRDVIEDSIEYAMLDFVDKPISLPQIDSVTETVNKFIRTLVGRGALVDGNCSFVAADNSEVELTAGHIVFRVNIMPPIPGERITFLSALDISLLKSLLPTS